MPEPNYLAGLTSSERRAVAIVGLLLRMHGGRDGEGLFTGMSRYDVLFGRLKGAAERSLTVRGFWDLLVSDMRWSLHAMKFDALALALLAPQDDWATLEAFARNPQHVVMIARQLHRASRDGDDQSASGSPAPIAPDLDDPLDIFDRLATARETDDVA